MEDQSIGMMEGAFFVGKGQILAWVNKILDLNVYKIEQLGSGNIYCKIFDVLFPGKIQLNRVHWKARNEWQFLHNWKLLQSGFQKCNIKKYIEYKQKIEKLAKAKYQDNLQFAQWMKRFYDLKGGPQEPTSKSNNFQVDISFVQLLNNINIRRYKQEKNLRKFSHSASKKQLTIKKTKPINSQQHVLELKLSEIKNICLQKEKNAEQKISQILEIVKDVKKNNILKKYNVQKTQRNQSIILQQLQC